MIKKSEESEEKIDIEPQHTSHLTALLAMLLAAICFGTNSAILKLIHMDLVLVIQIRFLLQWVFNLSVVLYRWSSAVAEETGSPGLPLTRMLFGPPEARSWLLGWIGLYFGFCLCWYSALKLLPVGVATTILFSNTVFTVLFAWLLLGELPKDMGTFIVAAVFAFSGVCLVQSGTDSETSTAGPAPASAHGYLLVALAGLAVALMPSFQKRAQLACGEDNGEMHWYIQRQSPNSPEPALTWA